jgi:hypothetical protein
LYEWKLLKNGVLRRYLEEAKTEMRENCSVILDPPTHREDCIGHEEGDKLTPNLRKKREFGDFREGERTIILKLILKRSTSVWSGFVWFRIGPSAGCCEHGNEPLGSINGKEYLNFLAFLIKRDEGLISVLLSVLSDGMRWVSSLMGFIYVSEEFTASYRIEE